MPNWMTRKAFTSIDEPRGMLSVAPDGDEAVPERADYVSALQEANSSDYGPW